MTNLINKAYPELIQKEWIDRTKDNAQINKIIHYFHILRLIFIKCVCLIDDFTIQILTFSFVFI